MATHIGSRNARVAILLPNIWRGGMLRQAFALARLIAGRAWDGVGPIEVAIGLLHDAPYDWQAVETAVADSGAGVSLRRMTWTTWSTTAVGRMFPGLRLPQPDMVPKVALPRDYRHNFLDCDAWIVFGQSLEGYTAPVRPYAVYCADLIQRHVPEIFDNPSGTELPETWAAQTQTFLGWRSARCVFSTTPATVEAVVGYAGVSRARALLVPTLIDPLHKAGDAISAGGLIPNGQDNCSIVWVTHPSPHKNHAAAVNAARIYYEELGGTLPLTITGVNSQWINPASGQDTLGSRAFRQAPEVLVHTRFAGEVSDSQYLRLIGTAAVVWHNVIIDNGTFVAFDAARTDRHFVTSDYPQMRYLCDRYGVAAIWHRSNDPRGAAEALRLAEDRYRSGQPPGHRLRRDAENERIDAYGGVLKRIFEGSNA